MPDAQRIQRTATALAERQVVDGIEDIGFAHAIAPNEAIYVGRELQFDVFEIAIIKDLQACECHCQKKAPPLSGGAYVYMVNLSTVAN